MKSNKDICIAFLNKTPSKNANMCCIGHKLLSYGTCIAQHFEKDGQKPIIIINTTKYSKTTSKQLKVLYNLIDKEKYDIKEVSNQPFCVTNLI